MGKRWKKSHLIIILHFISEIPTLNKTAYSNGYTHLNSRVLQKYVRQYKQFLQMLLDEQVLESDNIYIPNEKARGFRFTKTYRTRLVAVECKEIKTDVKFREKKFNTKAYPHLTKWFNADLKINKELAEAELFFSHLEQGHVNGYPISSFDFQITKFSNQQFYFFRDITGFRLHTSMLIKKELRPFITYKSEKLVAIDIVNAQPMMSLMLFNLSFYAKGTEGITLHNIYPELYNLLSKNTQTTTPTTLPLMVGVIEELQNKEDVKLYKELVLNGQLYEYMGAKLKMNDRALAKETMFSVLYSANKYFNQKEALPKRIFCEAFPNVYKLLAMFKAEQKNALAVLLQRIEAKLILSAITKRISIERTELPLFTLHDAIVTTLGNEQYIDMVLKEECAKVFGWPPKTKIEPWCLQHNLTQSEFMTDTDSHTWFVGIQS